jgi:dTDP-4-amino-4,6-dideoxygalactose transaminase
VIPVLDVGATYEELRAEIDEAVRGVLHSGWYIGGPSVEAFEQEWAAYCGASHCVGTGNGLEALALSLRVLGVGPGDEVIVPANTYIATWLAVSMVGATPVPVEPDEASHCIDPTLIAAAVTERTRCIMPVHLYGHPCAMDEIMRVARENDLLVVEDAAQAHGAAVVGRKIGTHGDAVAWSFYPTKNLGAFGDAGAITINRADIANKLMLLRNYGSATKNVHDIKGVNSRLDPVQAAILSVKLKHLDRWQDRRQQVARRYAELFNGSNRLVTPTATDQSIHAWHLYVIRVDQRDEVIKRLAERGVASMAHYPTPPFLQGAYAEMKADAGRWPLSTRLAETVLSIPMGPHMKPGEVERVAEAVTEAVGE